MGLVCTSIVNHMDSASASPCNSFCSMMLNFAAAFGSTFASMLGPGLALRGPDGSMHRAVDGLMLEYRLTFLFFTAGLVMFHISALLFAWLEFSWPVALAMTLALIMFIWGMYKYGMRIYRRFALTGDGFITGKFEIGDDGTVRRRYTYYGSTHESRPSGA